MLRKRFTALPLNVQQHGTDPPGHHGGCPRDRLAGDHPRRRRGARSYSQDNYLKHLMLAAAELDPHNPYRHAS